MNEQLIWLQNWYDANCNGDWEHSYSIKIETLDNPGWMVKIHLNETVLENVPFQVIELERSENDWIHCRVESNQFISACGSKNLLEVLTIFQNWALSTSGELSE